jgi:hypothetical protein
VQTDVADGLDGFPVPVALEDIGQMYHLKNNLLGYRTVEGSAIQTFSDAASALVKSAANVLTCGGCMTSK